MLGRRSRIEIKTAEQLRHMRAAGLVVARALAATADVVAPGVTTGELDAVAAQVIADAGARSNFKGYHGFPGVICTSVNDEVVHGIPGDRVLREGDLISIDCGAIVEGWHGDAAITVAVGEVRPELLELSPDPGGSGQVVSREFRGHDVFYRVLLDGVVLISQRPSNEIVPLGARVSVRLHDRGAVVLS